MDHSARETHPRVPPKADRTDATSKTRKQSSNLIRVITAGQALQAEHVTSICKKIFDKYDICDLEHLIRPIYFLAIAVVEEVGWEPLDSRYKLALQTFLLDRRDYESRASKALVRIGADYPGLEIKLNELDTAVAELERRMAAEEQYLEVGQN